MVGVVGSVVCQNGSWRLSWFNGPTVLLTSHAGPVGDDVEALAESLSGAARRPGALGIAAGLIPCS